VAFPPSPTIRAVNTELFPPAIEALNFFKKEVLVTLYPVHPHYRFLFDCLHIHVLKVQILSLLNKHKIAVTLEKHPPVTRFSLKKKNKIQAEPNFCYFYLAICIQQMPCLRKKSSPLPYKHTENMYTRKEIKHTLPFT